MSGQLLGEWAAFERYEGPLLVTERIDMLYSALTGRVPPWPVYKGAQSQLDPADALAAQLTSMARKAPIKQPRRVK